MDQFSYLSVLLSIILGLAITQVLKGFRGMLLTRARIRFYWPTVLWSFTLLLMFVQSWWAMFGMRNVGVLDVSRRSASIVLQTILEYMLAATVLPDFFGTETIDLREHYYSHARWFFGMTVAVLATVSRRRTFVEGHFAEPADVGFQVGFLVDVADRGADAARLVPQIAGDPRDAWRRMIAYILLLFMRLH